MIFNVVCAERCSVLDLFAGSGSLGIEALSRGAVKAIFVDNNRSAIRLIQQNLEKTRFSDSAQIVFGSVRQCLLTLSRQADKFDLILMDPPYRDNVTAETIAQIAKHNLLSRRGRLVVETRADAAGTTSHYTLEKEKLSGDTKVSFLINE